jgi:hypothetical protein
MNYICIYLFRVICLIVPVESIHVPLPASLFVPFPSVYQRHVNFPCPMSDSRVCSWLASHAPSTDDSKQSVVNACIMNISCLTLRGTFSPSNTRIGHTPAFRIVSARRIMYLTNISVSLPMAKSKAQPKHLHNVSMTVHNEGNKKPPYALCSHDRASMTAFFPLNSEICTSS